MFFMPLKETVKMMSVGGLFALQQVASEIEREFPHVEAVVERTWADYKQRVSWTTLVVKKDDTPFGSAQVLNPRQWNAFNSGEFSEVDKQELFASVGRFSGRKDGAFH